MKLNSLIFGASFAVLATGGLAVSASATPGETGHEAAIEACSIVNPSQPVSVLNAVYDGSGIGFSLVWLTDNDGWLWMCNADADGGIYSYSVVTGDLLQGEGPELIGLQLTSSGGYGGEPQTVAEKVCAAYLGEGGNVLLSAPDGFPADPGFIVFVQDAGGFNYLCNATGDAMVWAFEPVGDPIEIPTQVS